MQYAAHGSHFRLSGPVKNGALGPARPAGALLRVRGFLHWAAGTLASGSVAVPRPSYRTGPCGPTDMLRQGVRPLLAGRAIGSGQGGPPACLRSLADAIVTVRTGRRHLKCFAVNPERPEGVRGQNLISLSSRWLSEISIAIA